MPELEIPRIVIGGTRSGAGKTMLTIGLMRALKELGLKVAPFKIGPDYIDPMFHGIASERSSRNLDSYMMDAPALLESFSRGCEGADIAVVEGVMGLFDSHNGVDEAGSTAQVAKIIGAPVILIADCSKIARSAAALVQGFKSFDSELNLRGAVLNKIGSSRHKDKVVAAVSGLAGVEVIGAIPNDSTLKYPQRHLGLVPAHELEMDIDRLASFVKKHLNLDRVLQIAGSAPSMQIPELEAPLKHEGGTKVGVLYDDAFRFYYPETLRQISERAEPVFIDSIRDRKLPKLDFLYIGGGFKA
jgi:cobyrinic acid a,c-diamide synthase